VTREKSGGRIEGARQGYMMVPRQGSMGKTAGITLVLADLIEGVEEKLKERGVNRGGGPIRREEAHKHYLPCI